MAYLQACVNIFKYIFDKKIKLYCSFQNEYNPGGHAVYIQIMNIGMKIILTKS